MLANVLIALGVFGFATQLLNVVLSDQQKTALANRLTRIWYWLDEMRKPSFVGWVRRPWPQGILIGFCLLIGIWYSYAVLSIYAYNNPFFRLDMTEAGDEISPTSEKSSDSGMSDAKEPEQSTAAEMEEEEEEDADAAEKKPFPWRELLRYGTLFEFIRPIPWTSRAVVFAIPPFAATLVGVGIGLWVVRRKANSLYVPIVILLILVAYYFLLLYLLRDVAPVHRESDVFRYALFAMSSLGLTLYMIFLMWLVVALPLAFALIAAGLLAALETFVRKLIEYPSGPITALNSASLVVGGLFKSFG